MVRYSKRSISTTVSDRLIEILSSLLLRKNKNELKLVLDLLLTKAERTMILKRIGIQYMLLKKNDKGLICEILKVSSSTVAYYAIQLETQKEELASLLKSILLSEKMSGMLEDIIANILIQPHLYGSHKRIESNYKILKERKKYL
ncbi:hypothetical protein COZ40_01495 [Candidatus Roizmanbacteria bacterium CG_4_10_14_3_um_filter_39_13]|uniref:Uncharacterized protein n=3 Tax=Candidatus Roizmaniibacteriota TaxID=1752723 RepID=A0A2M7EKC3_9BACT|nr:MAG: hypothetical protein COS52_01255 [Candidatus Roizmanbacteria bacterium CG03_land_8_20_14_0_80_39_12]PIV71009.1 MAG: hypothetical protein COW57_02005 [Candidatus Roizmanbacteria bacterium CG17_big_fil_post_rev_8_21_14_2_50_39_7]PIX68774.1 MAG: hypothetical protein COZ40_01495 [Candidatus Roizmanbacteria bacterium CG_4_10_14_3_um_filter_39_13]